MKTGQDNFFLLERVQQKNRRAWRDQLNRRTPATVHDGDSGMTGTGVREVVVLVCIVVPLLACLDGRGEGMGWVKIRIWGLIATTHKWDFGDHSELPLLCFRKISFVQ